MKKIVWLFTFLICSTSIFGSIVFHHNVLDIYSSKVPLVQLLQGAGTSVQYPTTPPPTTTITTWIPTDAFNSCSTVCAQTGLSLATGQNWCRTDSGTFNVERKVNCPVRWCNQITREFGNEYIGNSKKFYVCPNTDSIRKVEDVARECLCTGLETLTFRCHNNHLYWFDSTGTRHNRALTCQNGCAENACLTQNVQTVGFRFGHETSQIIITINDRNLIFRNALAEVQSAIDSCRVINFNSISVANIDVYHYANHIAVHENENLQQWFDNKVSSYSVAQCQNNPNYNPIQFDPNIPLRECYDPERLGWDYLNLC